MSESQYVAAEAATWCVHRGELPRNDSIGPALLTKYPVLRNGSILACSQGAITRRFHGRLNSERCAAVDRWLNQWLSSSETCRPVIGSKMIRSARSPIPRAAWFALRTEPHP